MQLGTLPYSRSPCSSIGSFESGPKVVAERRPKSYHIPTKSCCSGPGSVELLALHLPLVCRQRRNRHGSPSYGFGGCGAHRHHFRRHHSEHARHHGHQDRCRRGKSTRTTSSTSRRSPTGPYYKRSGTAFGHTPTRSDFLQLSKVNGNHGKKSHQPENGYSSGSTNPSPPLRPGLQSNARTRFPINVSTRSISSVASPTLSRPTKLTPTTTTSRRRRRGALPSDAHRRRTHPVAANVSDVRSS